jgi:hypothetical protein
MSQRLRCVQRPIRITKHLAGQKYQVGLFGAYDVVCLRRRSNHADCTCGDLRFVANAFREWGLIAGTQRERRTRNVPA